MHSQVFTSALYQITEPQGSIKPIYPILLEAEHMQATAQSAICECAHLIDKDNGCGCELTLSSRLSKDQRQSAFIDQLRLAQGLCVLYCLKS